jgi:hypothetical protein
MSLFVVKHQHSAETCPAGHPQMGPMLAQHVSHQGAEQFGLNLHGEAVVDGAHTLFLILDGERDKVDQFMAPFTQVGSVEVLESSRCEQVVARARC